MKRKLLLSVSIIMMALVSNAQFKKGSVLLGGDVSGSFQNNEQTGVSGRQKYSTFNFSPAIGVATKENLFVGGSVSYLSSKAVSSNNDKLTSNGFGAGFFIRKYKSIMNLFYVFLQPGLNTSFTHAEVVATGDSYVNTLNTGITLTPGLSIKISKKVFLETSLSNIFSLSHSRIKSVDKTRPVEAVSINNNFTFSSSLSAFSSNLGFGFRIILPK
jgi:hypothetical protein